jgi:hypothetical protein
MENQHTFEELLQIFIKTGWKLIFTIRTTYKESFHNILQRQKNIRILFSTFLNAKMLIGYGKTRFF